MAEAKVFPLKCGTQLYLWGKKGRQSEVARLLESSPYQPGFSLNPETTYAELWMGTHKKSPCYVSDTDKTLEAWIDEHPDCLGQKVREKFKGQLPFLMKVLSFDTALPLQAHPNKKHAEELFARHPEKYPDDNHKPEIAIALTPMRGMCGFRPLDEIAGYLKEIPEFYEAIGAEAAEEFLSAASASDAAHQKAALRALKKCFRALMVCNEEVIAKLLAVMDKRMNKEIAAGRDVTASNGELFLQLHKQYPADRGCFSIYLLNVVDIGPNQAIDVPVNEAHAYISGDCVEVLANGDNVVCGGLTDKQFSRLNDFETLSEMLRYDPAPCSDKIMRTKPDPSDPNVVFYDPGIDDFAVAKIEIPSKTKSYVISRMSSASIVLVVKGDATGTNVTAGEPISFKRGAAIFISANQDVRLKISSKGLLMFRAYCPV